MINLLRKIGMDMGAGKKEVLHDNGGVITIRPSEWVEKGSLEYESMFKREQTDSIRTNIEGKKMYSLTSQAKDWFLEMQLRSDKYKFNKMLIVEDPFGEAPLTALALFTTIMDYRVRATVRGDSEQTSFVFEYPAEKRHRIPILGLYPGRETEVVIELLDENGESCDCREFSLSTKPLPQGLPEVIEIKEKQKVQDFCNTLVSGGSSFCPFVRDREGRVRYYLARKLEGCGIFPLSKGRFLCIDDRVPNSVQMYDMDFLGRVGRTYLVDEGVNYAIENTQGGSLLVVAGNSAARCFDESDFAGGNSGGDHSIKDGTATSGSESGGEKIIMEIDRETGEKVLESKSVSLFGEEGQDSVSVALAGISGIFRAYECFFDQTSLSKALVKNSNYIVGDVRRPILLQEEPDVPGVVPVTEADVHFEMQEDILYVYPSDPAVTGVCFRGKTCIWEVKAADTYQPAGGTNGAGQGMAIWLDVLPADTYDVCVWLGDKLQDTGKKITKQK